VVAVLAGATLALHADPVGWTDFAFPDTVLAAFAPGLACRTVAGAVLAGLTWRTSPPGSPWSTGPC
jgi:hypothetical protein